MADDNEIKAKITVDASQVGPAVEGAASNVESALARMKAAEASASAEIKATFAALATEAQKQSQITGQSADAVAAVGQQSVASTAGIQGMTYAELASAEAMRQAVSIIGQLRGQGANIDEVRAALLAAGFSGREAGTALAVYSSGLRQAEQASRSNIAATREVQAAEAATGTATQQAAVSIDSATETNLRAGIAASSLATRWNTINQAATSVVAPMQAAGASTEEIRSKLESLGFNATQANAAIRVFDQTLNQQVSTSKAVVEANRQVGESAVGNKTAVDEATASIAASGAAQTTAAEVTSAAANSTVESTTNMTNAQVRAANAVETATTIKRVQASNWTTAEKEAAIQTLKSQEQEANAYNMTTRQVQEQLVARGEYLRQAAIQSVANARQQAAAANVAAREQVAAQGSIGAAAKVASQEASGAAIVMAGEMKKAALSFDDANAAMKGLGFTAKDTVAALEAVGYAAEEAGAKTKYSFLQARSAALVGAEVISGGSPQSMLYGLSRLAAASQTLGPILEAAFPVIGAIALIEVLGQIPDAIAAIQDAMAGWHKAQQQLFDDGLKGSKQLLEFYDRIQQRQAEQAGAAASAPAARIQAQVAALGVYQDKASETQKVINKLNEAFDRVEYHKEVTSITHFSPLGPGAPINTATPAIDTPENRKAIDDQINNFNAYIAEEAKKLGGQSIEGRQVDVINWSASDKTNRENIQKARDQGKELVHWFEDQQTEANAKRKTLTDEGSRAQTEADTQSAEIRIRGQRQLSESQIELETVSNKQRYQIGQISLVQFEELERQSAVKKIQVEIDYQAQLRRIRITEQAENFSRLKASLDEQGVTTVKQQQILAAETQKNNAQIAS
jgi:hypothetical protein